MMPAARNETAIGRKSTQLERGRPAHLLGEHGEDQAETGQQDRSDDDPDGAVADRLERGRVAEYLGVVVAADEAVTAGVEEAAADGEQHRVDDQRAEQQQGGQDEHDRDVAASCAGPRRRGLAAGGGRR